MTPIQRDRTRYDWFFIWKSYLSLLFLVIIVEMCAKAPYRINRYCLKRVSGVTFSKNNGSDGLNLKTVNNGNGRWRPYWISTFRLVKIQNDFRNGLCVKHLIGKVVLHRFLGPFYFWSTFSIWPPVAILNLDVWDHQNTRNDTRK